MCGVELIKEGGRPYQEKVVEGGRPCQGRGSTLSTDRKSAYDACFRWFVLKSCPVAEIRRGDKLLAGFIFQPFSASLETGGRWSHW